MTNKHLLLMAAGCLIPLAALAGVFLFGLSINYVLLAALLLFCPLSHLFMMKFLMNGHETPPAGNEHRELPLP